MAARIAMAVYSTHENNKDEYLRKTLFALEKTVDFNRHELIVSINGKTNLTDQILFDYRDLITDIIVNEGNIGTAKAINKAWLKRKPGQHCVKMDDDVIINNVGWLDELEEAMEREPSIGILGLKRKDLIECTTHQNAEWRSELIQLPHAPGQSWIVVEKAKGIMGTCQLVNYRLIDKIGYLFQPTKYGFDDSLYSCRSTLAGFINCFLPHINIDHIDPGGTLYTKWKQDHAGETLAEAQRVYEEYIREQRPIYEEA